jgi:hypothetical protein
MAGFEVISERPRTTWVPVETGQTLYNGQIVSVTMAQSYAIALATSTGTPDTTVLATGVIVGNNRKEPVYSSTYNANYITGVATQADQKAVEKVGVEGTNGKGDPLPMVQVALIDKHTILKGRIFYGSYGTVLPTVTAASATGGSQIVTASITTSGVFGQTWYGLSGLNKGIYRVESSTSATTHDFVEYFPNDVAAGDTFRYVTLRKGRAYAKLISGMFIDGYVATISAYHLVNILELNLEESGNEYAIFQLLLN